MKNSIIRQIFLLLLIPLCKDACAQVNRQTGSATFSLPLFEWQDDKSRLSSGISLNYNSGSGLLVNSVSSDVGQGWNIGVGGFISRVQVGEPDDQKPQDGNYSDISKYPPGYLYNPISASVGCPNTLTQYPLFTTQNQFYKPDNSVAADRERDYFNFQFNGRSGSFIIEKGSESDIGVTLGDSKLKIWFRRDETVALNQHIRTTIVAFYIQDENGLIYKFERYGLTTVLRDLPSNSDFSQSIDAPIYNVYNGIYYQSAFNQLPLSANPYVINDWYLSQIQDPFTARTIDLNYEVRNVTSSAGDNIMLEGVGSPDQCFDPKNFAIINHLVSVVTVPVISSINYPDGHTVSFLYDLSNPRVDQIGRYPLSNIDITYYDRHIKRYDFNTTYFILSNLGKPSNPLESKASRLCLKSIRKIGPDLKDEEPPYVFDYYTGTGVNGDIVPPPFSYLKDIWGYYNGAKANSFTTVNTDGTTSPITPIPFNGNINSLNYSQLEALCYWSSTKDNVNPLYARNGLIKTITYPGKETITYAYDQNMATTQTYAGGVHVSSTTLTDGTGIGGSMPSITNYRYINEDGTPSLWGYETPVNTYFLTSLYDFGLDYPSIDPTADDNPSYNYSNVNAYAPGVSYKEKIENAQQLSAFQKFLGSQLFTFASGVFDLYTTLQTVAGESTVILFLLDYTLGSFPEHSCDPNYLTQSTGASFNFNLNGANMLPVQFKRVVVSQGTDPSNSPNGQTIFEYTSSDDYPLLVSSNPNHSMKQRAPFWTYGLVKKIIVKDAMGNKLRETDNIYSNDNSVTYGLNTPSCHCTVSQSFSEPYYAYFKPPVYSNANSAVMAVDIYDVYSGHIQLTDTYDKVFKPSDETIFLTTVTHFDYNANNYQVNKVTTVQSNGDKKITETYYPVDYTSGGVLQSMVTNNVLNIPIATFNSTIKANSTEPLYLGAIVNDFSTLFNNDIKPSRILSGRSTSPITGFSFDSGNPFNYPGLTETQILTYDQSTGNLIGIKDEGAHAVTNIYDYNDKFLVASIVNADPLLDASAYTSFETSSFGGWIATGNVNSVANSSITGSKSFILDGRTLSVPSLNTTKSYKLSFWATGSVNLVGGSSSLVTSTPVINGFTYYEYNIEAGASYVSLSGTGNIDELRLYPKNSRMRTTTYDPIIGKTSQCDENNRITYYGYDSLGRLQFIKDEYGNIVKMYEYNLKY